MAETAFARCMSREQGGGRFVGVHARRSLTASGARGGITSPSLPSERVAAAVTSDKRSGKSQASRLESLAMDRLILVGLRRRRTACADRKLTGKTTDLK